MINWDPHDAAGDCSTVHHAKKEVDKERERRKMDEHVHFNRVAIRHFRPETKKS